MFLRLAPSVVVLLAACASPTVSDFDGGTADAAPRLDATARPDAATTDAATTDAAIADAAIADAAAGEDAAGEDAAGDAAAVGEDAASTQDAAPGPDVPTAASTPPTARQSHMMLTLADGRIMVVGGIGGANSQTESYLYDPAADHWSRGPAVPYPLIGPATVQLDDGRVLMAGGAELVGSRTSTIYRSALLFDPVTRQFAPTGRLRDRRSGARAYRITRGPDQGQVLVVGGVETGGQVLSLELYDPATGQFTVANTLAASLATILSAQLDDGRLLLLSTVSGPSSTVIPTTTIYDPDTRALRTLTSTRASTQLSFVLKQVDGRVLVVDGMNRRVDRFDPTTETFTAVARPPEARRGTSPLVLADGRVLLLGGSDLSTVVDAVLVYTPAADSWATHPTRLMRPMSSMTAAEVGPRVLLVGGQVQGGLVAGTVMFFVP